MHQLVGHNFAYTGRATRLIQEQVEEQSDISQQSLNGLERRWGNLTVVTVYELAQVLGINHLDLQVHV